MTATKSKYTYKLVFNNETLNNEIPVNMEVIGQIGNNKPLYMGNYFSDLAEQVCGSYVAYGFVAFILPNDYKLRVYRDNGLHIDILDDENKCIYEQITYNKLNLNNTHITLETVAFLIEQLHIIKPIC